MNSKWIRVVLVALVAAFSGLALAACAEEGHSEGEKEVVIEGEPLELGPLEYNVLFTRPLNRFDVEDREYLSDQPAPGPGMTYIGVFAKVKNLDDDASHTIPESFEIVDTAGGRYENIPSDSIYALQTGAALEPGEQDPQIDSTAQVGPIQASLLLYLVEDEVLELRPVELELEDEEEGELAAVELDL